jgi:hypothetical protein
MTDIRFAFETLQNDHDAKTFGFATEGPSLARQEFAQACDINVLMAYGRCLRPALYSSLRSSPSHPTGVSALRVTIAIANARFARKQWRLRRSPAKSRRPFRNESATSRRVRAGAIGGSTAMTRTASCRKSPRAPRVCWLGSWALGTSDRGGQDKARKVRAVGRGEESRNFKHLPNILHHLAHLPMFGNTLSSLYFRHPMSPT